VGQPGGDRRGRQGWDDPTGKWPDWLDSAASAVGDGISTAWNSTTEWVDEHQADIVAGVAGAVVGGGCLLLSAGAGSIACGALGGAAAGAASHARRAQIQHTEEFSWGALGREAVIGGATGALTAGVGNALRPVTSRASRQARPALVAGSRPQPRLQAGEARPRGRITPPAVFRIFPKDLVNAPREFAERFFDVRSWTEHAAGGHFAAWEQPAAYEAGIRAAVDVAQRAT